jgi:DNA-binding beta-propeller fold protein YncE
MSGGWSLPLRSLVASAVAALALLGAPAAHAASSPDGRIGPGRGLLNNGRQLHPFGTLAALGNLPTGGAVTPDGRFYWTVSTGRGINDIRIVSVTGGAVVQTVRLAGASGGIAMDPVHPLVYVSGVADSTHAAQKSPPGTPGLKGDTVLVFRYDRASGAAAFDRQIDVPPPSGTKAPQAVASLLPLGTPPPQSFPPTDSTPLSWPDRLAVSPDGSTVLVPLNLAAAAAVINTADGSVRYVKTGNYPYGAAIGRDGRFGYVSNETPGTVSIIDLRAASKVGDVQVGGHLSHPEAVLADPAADRIYVTVTNSDEVAVIDSAARHLERTLTVQRGPGLGTAPDALAVDANRHELLVAEGGGDEISAFALPGHGGAAAWTQLGRIPTAQYPTDVRVAPATAGGCTAAKAPARKKPAKHRKKKRKHKRRRAARHKQARPRAGASAKPKARHKRAHRRRPKKRRRHQKPRRPAPAKPATCAKLLYVSAKALGTGPNPGGPRPNTPQDSDDNINATQYLPLLNTGAAGIGPYPSDAAIAGLEAVADAQVRPSNAQAPPADTPLRPGGPIKHVFYIVRENRTYDQVLGDDPRGDGDPKLALFGSGVTPNAHALVGRFPLVDHFYANSEASIDGHFWTSAASTSDYVHKNWFQNYAGRGRPYDFGVYAVTWPANGFLFDQADRQGISYFNYGEAIAGVVPFPDQDRTAAEDQRVMQKYGKSDLGAGLAGLSTPLGSCYPNDASIGKDVITGQTVFDSSPPLGAPPGSESRADCFKSRLASQLSGGDVPAFNYLVLSNDHTRVLDPRAYTPRAMVADNDLGLAQIVDAITHSSVWSSSAIFVTEDDSQDGADHVDAHRTVGLVISPYTRRSAVVHTRYDMPSMIRSMELIVGMEPLGLYDASATPMYDAFSATPDNLAAYTAVPANVNLLETNPPATSAAAARRLRFRGLDQPTHGGPPGTSGR